MTHVPSSKISKRDPGCRVSKTGVNLHEIVGIRLDDISKQGLMHEHVGNRVKNTKKQRKLNRWHKAIKASITLSHGAEKDVYQAHQYHGDVSHKRLHPNKPQEERMQPHKQVALKTDKHKPTEDAKHGKSWI